MASELKKILFGDKPFKTIARQAVIDSVSYNVVAIPKLWKEHLGGVGLSTPMPEVLQGARKFLVEIVERNTFAGLALAAHIFHARAPHAQTFALAAIGAQMIVNALFGLADRRGVEMDKDLANERAALETERRELQEATRKYHLSLKRSPTGLRQ